MVILGLIICIERDDLSNDRALKNFRFGQFGNITFGKTFLLFVRVKDRRAILRPCRVPAGLARSGRAPPKKNFEQLFVRNCDGSKVILTASACSVLPALTAS
jgi:hypothetical protein